MANKTLEARNCVRAFLGDGTPTPEEIDLARISQFPETLNNFGNMCFQLVKGSA